jgi:DNA polymerase III subunit alpha
VAWSRADPGFPGGLFSLCSHTDLVYSPAMPDFVHLHCHTEYSLLDGAIRVEDLCAKSVDFGLSAACITDHGNLFGAVHFYKAAKKHGIKPIIGCEVYVAPGDRTRKDARSPSGAGYHLVLLAQNREGYHNLVKLVTKGFLEGFHYKPRVDKELLQRYGSGLVALSACLKGEVPQKLRKEGFDAGLAAAREYAGLFPGRFYLELQANGMAEQAELNKQLLELSEAASLPLVATNDCHYLTAQDVEAHDVLLCIQTNATVDDPKRMRFSTNELYYRPPSEMAAEFPDCPEALANTAAIAETCTMELELGRHHFPVYEVPADRTLDEEFRRLSQEGLDERLKAMPYPVRAEEYRERLDEELEIICQKGFPSYFLIVQDFINWAKKQAIPVGPGRGSAAGSLVAYSLKITNLDPIRYKLLFERFLNVERESLPDIDVDFCYNRREEVIRYVSAKYGVDSVAQITTFGTMKAKAVIRDVGRALGMAYGDADRIAKLIPDELKMTLTKALEKEPQLRGLMNGDPRIARLIDISRRLEGLSRHASTHAAGIVISDKPMDEYLPLYRGKNGEVVTQYDMKKVEEVGLIKFDFLGLKTLTVIEDTLQLARSGGKEVPDLDTLPLDDLQTYELLGRGETDGVFQLESSGMRRVLVDLRPNCFEDVIALLALYRPGPLESGMVTDFIQRKHKETKVEYAHPTLEPILKETYGVILYQEQVMHIAQVLANYSLGDGDILRRAMGKKDPAVMAKQRSKFLEGARSNGIPEETANNIFDLMEMFAGYGFNKSHSAAYALISYQTAYLKTHFPAEFMAALMTSEVSNTDKVITHVSACRQTGLDILPPDVNRSQRHFSVEEECIRYGLSGIRNVGDGAIETIIEERDKNGPFVSLLDFCQRVNLRKVTKRVIEHLIKSGAMDCLGCPRAWLMTGMDRVVATAQKSAKDSTRGQLSLMALVPETPCKLPGLGLETGETAMEDWEDEERLVFEKEALGFYLSGHPLLPFEPEMRRRRLTTLMQALDMGPDSEVQTAVLVTSIKLHSTKKGGRMAFCQIEDLTGTGEATVFPETFQKYRELLQSEQPLLLKAKISAYNGSANGGEEGQKTLKLNVDEVIPLVQCMSGANEPVILECNSAGLDDQSMEELRLIMERHPGDVPVHLELPVDGAVCVLQLGRDFMVKPSPLFWREIKKWQER